MRARALRGRAAGGLGSLRTRDVRRGRAPVSPCVPGLHGYRAEGRVSGRKVFLENRTASEASEGPGRWPVTALVQPPEGGPRRCAERAWTPARGEPEFKPSGGLCSSLAG